MSAVLRVMAANGSFSEPTRVSWASGRFAFEEAAGAEASAEASAEAGADAGAAAPHADAGWIIPGLVDAHVHAAWHAFDATDREILDADPEAKHERTAAALAHTLRAGFTSVRDAGGLTLAGCDRISAENRPRVGLSVALIGRAEADAAGGLDRAVDAVLEAGATWVKLVATAGVAAPPRTTLESHFSAAEFASAVARADAVGAGVMVHAWGGAAIDHAIAAGAVSIEHGIYLTPAQARRAADAGTTFVPTLRIYRLVQQMISAGHLPAAFAARVDDAVAHHPGAVRIARDHGVAIALGTDYGTSAQHGTNRLEFDALVDAGLTPREALVAATTAGADLLARAEQQGAPREAVPTGGITAGAVADAVLLRRDPRERGALADPESIVGVLLGGRWIDPEPPSAAQPAPRTPSQTSHLTPSQTPHQTSPVQALAPREDHP